MASIKLSRIIPAPTDLVYQYAHYESHAWDPLGKKIHCISANGIIYPENRLKITAWHGQSMVVEYIKVSPPYKVAMKMIQGPWFLKSFSGTWRFTETEPGITIAQWYYHLRTRRKYRILEPILRLYFALESYRRLNALAQYCENRD